MDTENTLSGTNMVEILAIQNDFSLRIMQGSKLSDSDKLGILTYTVAIYIEKIRHQVNQVGCNYSYEDFLELIKEVHFKNEASIKEFKGLCTGKGK